MKQILELSFVLGLFINAALFIPQAIRIYQNKDSKEVSLITFVGFWLIQFATACHGFIRNDYILALGTIISMFTCGIVIWMIVYYRIKNQKR